MRSLLISVLVVALAVAVPIPFLKNARTRRSLAVMAIIILAIGALAFVLAEERGTVVNLATFSALIGMFWVAGRFEAK